ncbi:transcriptional regulator [Streptomyces filipinensis]|uniref:Transcriptional regulator n=1 Tax=Streptomyces filipinensis TaxID=66887 RepID=A0A918IH81_9ACTN|nr:transcriptional regulator [Streptomyces filipinensis]GGV17574.1 transcriptional regulator [Streptomyces filipinensis]
MADGITETGFAELLRELKDRSGHSYGMLAKRLHMSTSTLHRYCNGDAVPTDYAPVERLARLCRATPEELVELHRRWVLADAARGRRRTVRQEPAGQEPAGREPAGQQPVGQEPVGQQPVGQGPVAQGPVGQEPVCDVVPVREGTADDAASVQGRRVPDDGRPRRRTRTVLLAALTVTALLGTVALALDLSSSGTEHAGKTAPPDASVQHRAPTAGTTYGTDSTRSATPAPPSPTASPAPSTPGEAPSTPHTRRTPEEDPAATPPLAVTTHPYAWADPCSPHYLVDRAPTEVSPPPLEQDAPAWVAVHRAVSAREQYVTFTVQGTGSDTVVLEGLSVRTAGRRSPLAWNDYAMGYPGVGCGGGVPTRSFTVALDALRPAAVPESGQRGFPYKVSRSDPEVFHLTADASAYDVSWYLELSWSSGTRHGTLRVDDGGRPFRTSGNNGRPAYAFPLGGEKWETASEANAH